MRPQETGNCHTSDTRLRTQIERSRGIFETLRNFLYIHICCISLVFLSFCLPHLYDQSIGLNFIISLRSFGTITTSSGFQSSSIQIFRSSSASAFVSNGIGCQYSPSNSIKTKSDFFISDIVSSPYDFLTIYH